jgi:hypothetical protein
MAHVLPPEAANPSFGSAETSSAVGGRRVRKLSQGPTVGPAEQVLTEFAFGKDRRLECLPFSDGAANPSSGVPETSLAGIVSGF